jgi:hypothetical protein
MDWKNCITHVLDCGNTNSTIYYVKEDRVEVISHADVLNLPNKLPRGSQMVVENAHMGVPRTEKSLSQPFYADQLLEFYESVKNNGQKLWLFPQRSTPRACRYADLPKSDMTDPKSIYILLSDFPEINMKKPKKTFEPSLRRQEQWEFKEWTNIYCNRARAESPKYTLDECSKYLISNLDFIFESLSEGARDFFGFTYHTSTGAEKESRWSGRSKDPDKVKGQWQWSCKDGSGRIKNTALYSIAVTLIHPETGQPRLRPYTQQMAGKGYIKEGVFCMSPEHHRGGVARSNLYHWTIKPYIKRKVMDEGYNIKDKDRGGKLDNNGKLKPDTTFNKIENELFRKYRADACKYIWEVWRIIKDDMQSRFKTFDCKEAVVRL